MSWFSGKKRKINHLSVSSYREEYMYRWVVFLHVLGVFSFLLAHGASMNMAFALRRERDLGRLRALLDLSSTSLGVMYPSLIIILVTGILAGFQGHWWSDGWIWTAVVVLFAIMVGMYMMGTKIYAAAREAVGLPYMAGSKGMPATAPKRPEEIDAALKKANPIALAVLGYGGLAVLAFLMIIKPF